MERDANTLSLKQIAFIGNYLPRQCGIATFTADLCESVAAQYPTTKCSAVPVNDIEALTFNKAVAKVHELVNAIEKAEPSATRSEAVLTLCLLYTSRCV